MKNSYTIGYIYNGRDGAEERGQCEIKAKSTLEAIYLFYKTYGFKYQAISCHKKGADK